MVETHRPTRFRRAYHHHPSVEINFLIGCDMEYSFSGTLVRAGRQKLVVFWGAVPHGVTDVQGSGSIVNVYLSLAQLLKFGLPELFVETIISGGILASRESCHEDALMFNTWARDYSRASDDPNWRNLLIGEIEMRLRRMALEGYDVLMKARGNADANVSGTSTMRHIDQMLRFIADNYGNPISVAQVAEHVDLSPSYAMSLFRRVVGVPIKEHITRIRLSHAQMLLAHSDHKILSVAMDSGFGSLSSFYEAFQAHQHKTPAAFRREARQ